MHGDFSRVTFDPARHFSAVLSQQGRVQLDSELNEASYLMLRYLRQLAADLIGPAGVPLDPRVPGDKGGFLIDLVSGSSPADFSISAGRMYVDGILLENETASDYWSQPDGFLYQDASSDQLPALPYLVYVRAWEQLITAVEDPDIREIGLGDFGPDTSARSRVVWQVGRIPVERRRRHGSGLAKLAQRAVPKGEAEGAGDATRRRRHQRLRRGARRALPQRGEPALPGGGAQRRAARPGHRKGTTADVQMVEGERLCRPPH
jgi:hypothetical protein